MDVLDIYLKVKSLESKDIYLLLESRGVNIFHTPELFKHTESKGRIITDLFGNTSVFLRFNDGEAPFLENFILWHELGHFETEGIDFMTRSFNFETFTEESESDSNVFAFFGIMNSMSTKDVSFVDHALKAGIPMNIAMDCVHRVRQSERFIAYLNANKKDLPAVAKL